MAARSQTAAPAVRRPLAHPTSAGPPSCNPLGCLPPPNTHTHTHTHIHTHSRSPPVSRPTKRTATLAFANAYFALRARRTRVREPHAGGGLQEYHLRRSGVSTSECRPAPRAGGFGPRKALKNRPSQSTPGANTNSKYKIYLWRRSNPQQPARAVGAPNKSRRTTTPNITYIYSRVSAKHNI